MVTFHPGQHMKVCGSLLSSKLPRVSPQCLGLSGPPSSPKNQAERTPWWRRRDPFAQKMNLLLLAIHAKFTSRTHPNSIFHAGVLTKLSDKMIKAGSG